MLLCFNDEIANIPSHSLFSVNAENHIMLKKNKLKQDWLKLVHSIMTQLSGWPSGLRRQTQG